MMLGFILWPVKNINAVVCVCVVFYETYVFV